MFDAATKKDFHIKMDPSRDSLLTSFGKATLSDRYLLPNETYQEMFARVAAAYADDQAHAQRLYDYISNLWFMPATPILSNGGTTRGMPISCFLNESSDSMKGIVDLWNENIWLASRGGGIGSYWGNLRSIGEKVGLNGKTSGVIPFIRVMDSLTLAISQGSLRRGSAAVYLPVSHPEIEEFIEIRRPTGGDPNRRAPNLHHGILIPDAFMRAVEEDADWNLTSPKDGKVVSTVSARRLWIRILTARIETGEPYLVFSDRVAEHQPIHHKKARLKVNTSNLCFSGDTLVAVADGRNAVSIKELYKKGKPFEVYSATKSKRIHRGIKGGGNIKGSEWKSTIRQAKAVYTGKKKMIRVHLEDGDYLDCTPDHALALTRYGEWVEAKDSLGMRLEPFGTFKNEMKYRCVNSITSNKQHRLIWEYHNGPIPEGKVIDHKDRFKSDRVKNLQCMSHKKHHLKTSGEVAGKGNAIWKVDPNHRSAVTSRTSFMERNPRYSGLDDLALIELGRQYLKIEPTLKKLMRYISENGGPITLSKNRFQKWKKKGLKNNIAYLRACILGTAQYESPTDYTRDTKFVYEQKAPDTNWMYKETSNGRKWRGRKVVKIEKLPKQKCYDVMVLDKEGELDYDNHNFYIITSGDDSFIESKGVLVHNCSEITLPTGPDQFGKDRTAVCCLSSLNLELYAKWADHPMFIEDVMRFLDNVLQTFIDTAGDDFAKATYSAMRERSVGLGVMGFHSFLQRNNIALESVMATVWNNKIFKHIKEQCDKASVTLAAERGACPDAADYGINERFSHKIAIAPTASISIICGGASPGIEPSAANVYTHKTLSGSFVVRNPHLENLLRDKGRNDDETWTSITVNNGSVQHLDFLDDHEKLVYRTAFEIDQRWLIDHAAGRTPFICQSQSVNLFMPADTHKRDLHQIHYQAWKKGLKTLYYCRSLSIQRAEASIETETKSKEYTRVDYEECLSCQ